MIVQTLGAFLGGVSPNGWSPFAPRKNASGKDEMINK